MVKGWYLPQKKAKLGLLLEPIWENHGHDPTDLVVQCPCSMNTLQIWKRD